MIIVVALREDGNFCDGKLTAMEQEEEEEAPIGSRTERCSDSCVGRVLPRPRPRRVVAMVQSEVWTGFGLRLAATASYQQQQMALSPNLAPAVAENKHPTLPSFLPTQHFNPVNLEQRGDKLQQHPTNYPTN
ncbi:hypothetical protein HJC23_000094 [Cyclotella cryptica]|uniref:Uncharacterized protein n=1 Tax=Cyclotella cryptica TaxID=29204 RepID=A0ABD3P670_9STRA